jgi:hypothetical protein
MDIYIANVLDTLWPFKSSIFGDHIDDFNPNMATTAPVQRFLFHDKEVHLPDLLLPVTLRLALRQ